jgi:DNA-binding beta-propeller fold protein YncE
LSGGNITSIAVPLPPSGLAFSRDYSELFVTCAAPESKICIIDTRRLKIVGTTPAGHTATAPVLSADGRTLYVCNQFDNDVSVIELTGQDETSEKNTPHVVPYQTNVRSRAGSETGAPGKEVCRIAVRREPVAADITKDGKFLLVANQLPTGRADVENAAAVVSVINLVTRRVVKELPLPNGSGSLKDLRISPDGKYAAVTHIVSSFSRATTKVQFGWMNANALTIIDVASMEIAFSFLLDEPNHGAANPWGVA